MDVIDLNCDMGESFGAWTMGSDAEMLDIVTSANIACGFHGGDPLVMYETVSRAKENGVGIGAHPSFFDVWGFGRRMIKGEKPEDIEKIVVYQIGALQGMARAVGHRVGHLKAHGTLANLAAVERPTALAIGRAIAAIDRELIYVVMAGTELERAAGELGLRMAREIYADRAYDDTGNLVSRKLPGAVLHDPEIAAARVSAMVREGAIISNSGKRIPVSIDTVCVHGDNPAAVAMAALVRERLEGAGVAGRPMGATNSQGAPVALARVEIGEGADGDRLERGARAVGADFRYGFAERVGDDGRDDRAADPALAGSHAATGKRLELVWTLRAEPRGAAAPADRHLLAAARDDFVLCRDEDRTRRTVEAIEKRPQRSPAIERRPDRQGAAVALGFADITEPGRCGER